MKPASIRVGYIGGEPRKINERVIDREWTRCLGEYVETVSIPPIAIIKLFGDSIENWRRKLPASLWTLTANLDSLRTRYGIDALYVNLPVILPDLLMARNAGRLPLGFVCIAHSVGTEFWLKHWISAAPHFTNRDVLLVSSASSREALLRISPVYEQATLIPLCIRPLEDSAPMQRRSAAEGKRLLAIGRIEPAKNIHVLLRCFSRIRDIVPGVHLFIAGEPTGPSERAIAAYQTVLDGVLDAYDLRDNVTFTGPVTGEVKDQLFAETDVLLNLSTDLGETFGYNLLEAKLRGIPVVCTAWDGFRDIVKHGVEGFLAPCRWDDDRPVIMEQAVVDGCVSLLTDDTLHRDCSDRTYAEAEQFSHRIIMPKIVRELESALSTPLGEPALTAEACLNTAIHALDAVYRLSALSRLPFLHETPVSILSLPDSADPDWAMRVKPILHHYASEKEAAECKASSF